MLLLLKSKYNLKLIFSLLDEKVELYIIKYNKNLKNILGFDLGYYKNFSGRYIIGEKNGRGKEFSLNSKILLFEGDYNKGRRHGEGKEYYITNKLKFFGEFKNGQKNGKGREFDNLGGLKFEGEYKNNKRNGKGKEFYYINNYLNNINNILN